MTRRLPKSFVLIFSAAVLVIGFLFSYITYLSMTAPVDKKDDAGIDFTVDKGDSTLKIADNLESAGLIRSPFGFRLMVKLQKFAGKLQAGDYQLSRSMSAAEIANRLTKGYSSELRITIPEGYRTEEIAEKVEQVMGIPSADFIAASKGAEGRLFPDTYFFREGATAEQIVTKMKDEFGNKTKDIHISQADLILASLIERETKGNVEKPIVAGILQKRLQNNWPLQLDATVQYIAGKKGVWWPNTTLLDRERKSPFNTYQNLGLPPAPICNPGLESIKAAVNPEKSEYWFYLHDRQGMIHYAVDSAGHSSNIAKYIR